MNCRKEIIGIIEGASAEVSPHVPKSREIRDSWIRWIWRRDSSTHPVGLHKWFSSMLRDGGSEEARQLWWLTHKRESIVSKDVHDVCVSPYQLRLSRCLFILARQFRSAKLSHRSRMFYRLGAGSLCKFANPTKKCSLNEHLDWCFWREQIATFHMRFYQSFPFSSLSYRKVLS
jgi:hypothetical protein